MTRILVVDDEPDLCEILCFNLESEGYETQRAFSAEEALACFDNGQHYDLLLLDVMMDSMSGFDLAKHLRSNGNQIPIVFLTAKSSEVDMLDGFDCGADDYITKPFSFPAILARIKAVLRRTSDSNGMKDGILKYEGLEVDIPRKSVIVDGQPVMLTKKEFLILSLLLQHHGDHFSRQQIIDTVWDDDTYVSERSVDVHIARLRKKIGSYADMIVNHSGFGYVFVTE
ncbi:MAG: response regulator transcription factor [Bacteroidales bacterium]|nr:response regulator transcription factor [Bacteroidales bacterium]